MDSPPDLSPNEDPALSDLRASFTQQPNRPVEQVTIIAFKEYRIIEQVPFTGLHRPISSQNQNFLEDKLLIINE